MSIKSYDSLEAQRSLPAFYLPVSLSSFCLHMVTLSVDEQ